MKKGDHIYIYLRGEGVKFKHHGIYIGDDRVIHYWNGKVRRSKIYKSTWYGKTINIKKHKDSYENSRVVKRAKKRLGERKYHLICNNCEHFAYWCKTGEHKSTQVNEAPLKLFKKAEKTVKNKIGHEKNKLDKIIKKIKIPKKSNAFNSNSKKIKITKFIQNIVEWASLPVLSSKLPVLVVVSTH